MLTRIQSRPGLAALAAAVLLSVALPAGTAFAQKVKNKTTTETTAPSANEISVDIPTIETVDSSLDEGTLREIFSGEILSNAVDLAALDATSITIPEITVTVDTVVDDEPVSFTTTYTDIVLTDVVDGVAGSVAVAGASADSGDMGSFGMGSLTGSDFNIAALLAFYGAVESGSSEMQTIYSELSFDGATFAAEDVTCEIGAVSAGEFRARPLSFNMLELVALAETMEEAGEEVPPELMGQFLRMYAELFTAFESDAYQFDGFSCDGVDEEDRPINVAIGSMSIGEMQPGTYPAISVDGIEIAVEDDGYISLGNFTFKEMDLSAPLAALASIPDMVDEAWFTENARALIPAFEGFSFSDVAVDVPDPDVEGARIVASLGAFDLSLGEYFNGIPTDVSTTVENLVFDLPQNSEDEPVQQLLALGITSVDTGFRLAASWNEDEQTIAIDEVSVSAADLASVVLSGVIANATEALFAVDENEALAASMQVAINELNLDVTDFGLSDIIMEQVAAEQGADAATLRPVFAGLAQGTVIGLLAGAAEAQNVGSAISDFVSGDATNLTINMTAKKNPGLGLADFVAAEEDPSVLIGKVNIQATAE
ncbi:hypothetical protein [Devosia sp. RR2S18]|uniref:hypothetical protein n=1 Tax=Devosia rhizosphaerae TaxID=3049774 RepID=UPI002540DA3B|nr:hypothetical protein [Devosia sp. RR2S18]WIJ26750.1 hypothetical protein QOV41_08365 [Devosia sp. RR2S18]